MKRFFLLSLIAVIPVILAMGQSEMSVEESYLQESIENMIIREQSRSVTRESKMIALTYISDAIDRGNKGEEVRQALEYMGLEGLLNRDREGGRLLNNYPDVRRECARYLGKMGTPEAKDILLKMIYHDNEPMVLQEAIKSLGDIGIDDDGRSIGIITWIFQKFDNTNPDNLLALSVIETIEKLSTKGLRDTNTLQILIRISENPSYIRPVQDRARQALTNIRRAQAR